MLRFSFWLSNFHIQNQRFLGNFKRDNRTIFHWYSVLMENGNINYSLVPWISFDEWNHVYDSIFSSNPQSVETALKKVKGWKSRGCLPVSVDATASIRHIQERDPFFRHDITQEQALSEEALQMSYAMSITRLLNGVIDQSSKKSGRSIDELAETIEFPRTLVDIRHESSHFGLPSLSLLRIASKQAIGWLKSHYWEPQKESSNIQEEIKSTLLKFARHVKLIRTFTRRQSKSNKENLKTRIRSDQRRVLSFYRAFPSEVIHVLLNECLVKNSKPYDMVVDEIPNSEQHNAALDAMESLHFSKTIWKLVLEEICLKKADILRPLLQYIVKEIVAIDGVSNAEGSVKQGIEDFSFWLNWILGYLEKVNTAESTLIGKSLLKEMLLECLQSLPHTSSLAEPVLRMAKLLGKPSFLSKCQFLVAISRFDQISDGLSEFSNMTQDAINNSSCQNSLPKNSKTEMLDLRQASASLQQAKKQLQSLQTLVSQKNSNVLGKRTHQEIGSIEEGHTKKGSWQVVLKWKPCAIGKLPSTIFSGGILPDLEQEEEKVHEADRSCKKPCLEENRDVQEGQALIVDNEEQMNQERSRDASHISQNSLDSVKVDRCHEIEKEKVLKSGNDILGAKGFQISNNMYKEMQRTIPNRDSSRIAQMFTKNRPPLVTKAYLNDEGMMKLCSIEDLKNIQSAVRIFRLKST